jgi:hypothetical protein
MPVANLPSEKMCLILKKKKACVDSDLEEERSDRLMLKNKEYENYLVLKSEGLLK